MTSPDASEFKPKAVSSTGELTRMFHKSLAKAREALANTTGEHLMSPWRFVMIPDAVFSYLAHHRGQLTVYLTAQRRVDSLQPVSSGLNAA